jgi:hypothetical protein
MTLKQLWSIINTCDMPRSDYQQSRHFSAPISGLARTESVCKADVFGALPA